MAESVTFTTQQSWLKSGYAEAYNNLGNAKNGLGQDNAAIEDAAAALRLKPEFTGADVLPMRDWAAGTRLGGICRRRLTWLERQVAKIWSPM